MDEWPVVLQPIMLQYLDASWNICAIVRLFIRQTFAGHSPSPSVPGLYTSSKLNNKSSDYLREYWSRDQIHQCHVVLVSHQTRFERFCRYHVAQLIKPERKMLEIVQLRIVSICELITTPHLIFSRLSGMKLSVSANWLLDMKVPR